MKKIASSLWWVVLAGSLSCLPVQLFAGDAQGCSIDSAKAVNKAAKPYADAIEQSAERYGVKPELVKAVIATSSCYNPAKLSADGAIGLMQLSPLTARGFGALNVFDSQNNIDAGTRYLSYLSKRYEGNIAQILTAYAADEGWEWQQETITTPFAKVHEPVTQMLDILLKLDGNKQANREAKAALKQWQASAEVYQAALTALPATPGKKNLARWFKSRLSKVHYKRAPEERGCGGLGSKALAAKAAPYEAIIQKAAKRHGVSPALVKSVIATESCYREMVVSYKGASGLMQLMPETAAELGVFDIFDPEENINAGTRYLAWLVRHYGGSTTHAVAAYNAGPGRIAQNEPVTIAFDETRGYIGKVLTGLTRLETGKKAVENANLLLADWEQAELAYQAALRGEPLPEALKSPAPGADVAQPLVADSVPVAGQNPQPEIRLAYQRSEKAVSDTVIIPTGEQQPQVQLIPSALDEGIVRVKRVSMTTVEQPGNVVVAENMPVEALPAMVEAIPVMEEQPPGEPALPDCGALSPLLLGQAQLKGNGRYGALFYQVQAGDGVELIASKLGIPAQDIVWLNNLSPEQLPKAGGELKVAECSKG